METKLMALAAAIAVSLGAWAVPTVTDITAKQRYPWNGLVDITCKVSGIEAETGGYEFAVVAVDKDTDREYTVSNFSAKYNGEEVPDVCGNGDYSLLWNAREDMGQVVIERMTMRITLEALAVSVGKVQLWEGGPYWADRNIGAKKPEESGLYFWWGDTKGHRPGYNFSSDNSAIYTYDKSWWELQSTGWVTSVGIGVLSPSHDAAHVKWGGSWRMPTDAEFSALINNCTSTWTARNGVYGRLVTGKGAYANRSIFLPAAGYGDDSTLGSLGSYGYYWSSTPVSGNSYNAWYLGFHSSYFGQYSHGSRSRRYGGQSVRPVQGVAK